MIPSSYTEQKNKCKNCKHVFQYYDYESFNAYYCHIDKSERPLCGSVALNESHYVDNSSMDYITSEERRIMWEAWELTHQVDASGTCKEFERKE